MGCLCRTIRGEKVGLKVLQLGWEQRQLVAGMCRRVLRQQQFRPESSLCLLRQQRQLTWGKVAQEFRQLVGMLHVVFAFPYLRTGDSYG